MVSPSASGGKASSGLWRRRSVSLALTALMLAGAFAGINGVFDAPASADGYTATFSLNTPAYLATVVGDGVSKAYVVGGPGLSMVQTIDLSTETTSVTGMGLTVYEAGGAYLNGMAYTFGGMDFMAFPRDEIYAYDTASGTTAQAGTLPLPIYGSCAASDGRKIYLFGGYDQENWTANNMIWVFNPATGVVSRPPGSPVLPAGRYHASAVWTGAAFYILGGIEPMAGGYARSIVRYDPSTGVCEYVTVYGPSWTSYNVELPRYADMACSAYLDGKIYVYGGNDNSGTRQDVIQEFDPASKSALVCLDTLPQAISGAGCVAFGDRVFVIGGDPGSGISDDINVHKPVRFDKRETLTTVAGTTGFQLRGAMTARSGNGPAYILGGMDFSSVRTNIMRYDPATAQLKSVSGLTYAVSEGAAAVWRNKVFIFGGNNTGTIQTSVQIYDMSQDMCSYSSGTWLLTPLTGAKAFAFNDKIYIVGGKDDMGVYSNQILRYDPETETLEGAVAWLPFAVAYHGLAWDGEKAYIVGGRDSTGIFGVVQVFDPATLTASEAGYLPYGVWRAMVAQGSDGYVHIFGGRTDNPPYVLDRHIILDPSTMEAQTSSVNLPTRLFDGTIIDGDITLVGGLHQNGDWPRQGILRYRNDGGGRDGYSESTDIAWPDGVTYAASAYFPTDGATYVFGGRSYMGELDTIVKLDAGTGRRTVVGHMPHSRSEFSAVSLGSYIYVICGIYYDTATYLGTISRYDPATGAFVDVDTISPVRSFASACTDGSKIYIVGGHSGGNPHNTITVWSPSSGVLYTDSLISGVASPVVGYSSNRVYVAGGFGNSYYPTQKLFVYNTLTRTVEMTYTMPERLCGSFGGMVGSKLAICGGLSQPYAGAAYRYSDRVLLFDTVAGSMRYADFRLALAGEYCAGTVEGGFIAGGYNQHAYITTLDDVCEMRLSGRDRQHTEITQQTGILANGISDHAVAYDGQYVYTIGGFFGGGTVPVSEIIRYDPNNWAGYSVFDTGYGGTYGAKGVAAAYEPLSDRVYFAGGDDYITNLYYNKAKYITKTGTVASLNPLVTARSGHGMSCVDGNVFVAGGKITPTTWTTSVEMLASGSSSWTSSGNLRISSSTYLSINDFGYASDGQCMYIFGGEVSGATMKSARIYRYDPYSQNLTRMQASLPSARNYLSAVYDPEQEVFLVFGGLDLSGTYLDDILVYDPSIDSVWEADESLPTGLARMGAVYDAPMVIGGYSSMGRQNVVLNVDYVKDGPTASDVDSGPGDGIITLDTQYPQVVNHDVVESSTSSSVLNWQLEGGQEYSFRCDVGLASGFTSIDRVDVYAWYDGGNDGVAMDYNTTFGRARNLHFRYEYTGVGDTGVFQRFFPPSPDVTGFWGKATTLSTSTKRLEFFFTPSAFTAWADGVSGGSTPATDGDATVRANGFNDPNSWNFEIIAYDTSGGTGAVYDEFGVFKHQEITVSGGSPWAAVTPGGPEAQMDTSYAGDVTLLRTRINCAFRLNVNVTDLNGPETISATYLGLQGGDLAIKTYFSGPYYPNRQYVVGTNGGSWTHLSAVPGGGYYETPLTWYITVPGGVAEGTYLSYITYRMETADDPNAVSFNHAPWSGGISPGDGATGISHPTTIQVIAMDDDMDLVTVRFYDAADHSLLGENTVGSGAWASYFWATTSWTTYEWYAVLSDGQDETQTPVYTFTTGA